MHDMSLNSSYLRADDSLQITIQQWLVHIATLQQHTTGLVGELS